MERVGSDVYIGVPPSSPSIKSTFKLDLLRIPAPGSFATTSSTVGVLTDFCGLGWRFSIQRVLRSFSPGVKIFFVPGLLNMSVAKQVRVAVTTAPGSNSTETVLSSSAYGSTSSLYELPISKSGKVALIRAESTLDPQ